MADVFINSVRYALAVDREKQPVWRVAQQGQELIEEWTNGWAGGIGERRRQHLDTAYSTLQWDTSLQGYARLPRTATDITGLTGAGSTATMFSFNAEGTSGTDYTYILAGRYGFKIKRSTDTVVEIKDFGASAVCGRPALFEGKYYVALGASVDFVELTTVAEDPTTDTWTSAAGSMRALAFAVAENESGSAQLWRAYSTNLVATAATGPLTAGNWGSGFEVGDSSLSIGDMLAEGGKLLIFKPDNVYRFGPVSGASYPLIGFIDRSLILSATVRPAFVHGSFIYWPHSSGLWRILGDDAVPIGPFGQFRRMYPSNLTNEANSPRGVAGYGGWLYVFDGVRVCAGRIQADGTVPAWLEVWNVSSNNFGAAIESGATGAGPKLWVLDGSTVTTMELNGDGSPATTLGSDRGKADSSASVFILPEMDFGLGRDKEFQLRQFVIETHNFPAGGTASLQLQVYRNGGAAESVGAAITTDGVIRRAWTVGTNDLATAAVSGWTLTTNGSYTPANSDPMVLSCKVYARSPTIYLARLDTRMMSGYTVSNPREILNTLQALQSAARVALRPPDHINSFNGEVLSVSEQLVDDQHYLIDVAVRRWDIPASAA